MPIEVFTGIPGAGKTLRMLEEVEARGRKEGRQVYYNGIDNLAIDGWLEFANPEEWYKLPKGSIIVLDEAQRIFRPAHFAKEVPLFLSELETHRHNGYDIYMTTQRIMLLHSNLRGLIGRHVHVNRRFGTQHATLLEFPRAVEQPQAKMDDAVRHEWRFPQEVFKWYKSAEVHTIKRKFPAKLFLLLALPFVIGGLVYFEGSRLKSKMEPEKAAGPVASGRVSTQSPGGAKAPGLTPEWLAARQPRLGGLAQTAPIYDDLTKPVRVPRVAGCVVMGSRCGCFTEQATPLQVADGICRDIVAHGVFDDFSPAAPVAGAVAALPVVGPGSASSSGSKPALPAAGATGAASAPVLPVAAVAPVPDFVGTGITPNPHKPPPLKTSAL